MLQACRTANSGDWQLRPCAAQQAWHAGMADRTDKGRRMQTHTTWHTQASHDATSQAAFRSSPSCAGTWGTSGRMVLTSCRCTMVWDAAPTGCTAPGCVWTASRSSSPPVQLSSARNSQPVSPGQHVCISHSHAWEQAGPACSCLAPALSALRSAPAGSLHPSNLQHLLQSKSLNQ